MQTRGARILIVDDDPASRRLAEVRLRALECRVSHASDGAAALDALARMTPDLMLLDLQMPKMDGMEVLRRLKQERVELPVIVISAHGSIASAVEAMKEGAYDFITKPLDGKHFDIVVRRLWNGRD